MSEQRGVRSRRRLFRAPEGQAPAGRPGPAGRDLLPRLRVRARSIARRADFRRTCRRRRRGSKSASAAASISPPRREPIREIDFIGCEPFVNGMAKLLAGDRARRLDNIRIWDEDVTDLLPTPAGCVSRPRLHPLSRPMAEAPPAQAPPRLRRHAAGTRPRHAARRRAALCQRHRQLYRLGARPRAALGRFSLDRDGVRTIGANPTRAGPAPATRRRRSAKGACRAICGLSGFSRKVRVWPEGSCVSGPESVYLRCQLWLQCKLPCRSGPRRVRSFLLLGCRSAEIREHRWPTNATSV